MQNAPNRWPSGEELSELVKRAQEGQSLAIEALLAFLRPPLLSFFKRRLSADSAEDLTQRALVRVGGAVGRIDPERADVYISTVARNLLRTEYRSEARERSRNGQSDPSDLESNAIPVDTRVEYGDLVRAVHRACLKMRPGLRDVAEGVLRGDSATDVARSLDISPITVRTRLMRVRTILREELAPYLDGRAGGRRQA
jgi:RNA polymerase sigma factor (sigma-70 family)